MAVRDPAALSGCLVASSLEKKKRRRHFQLVKFCDLKGYSGVDVGGFMRYLSNCRYINCMGCPMLDLPV